MKSVLKIETQEVRIVKIYRKNELSSELVSMVKEEIAFFKTLDHPNIAKCLEVLEDEHKLYVVLD
jgi:hypothetical protein